MESPRHAAYVVVSGPGHDDSVQVLNEGITTFGRLPSNDVILHGDLVSRNHARITFFEARATLQDLGSHNGCFVNGERIETRVLKPRDKAQVGNFQVVFHEGDPPSRQAYSTKDALVAPRVAPAVPSPHRSTSSLVQEFEAARSSDAPSAKALRFVLRAAEALATAEDLMGYVDAMLELSLEQTGAESGAYLTIDDTRQVRVLGARDPHGPVGNPPVTPHVVHWAMGKNFPVRSEDLAQDIRFEDHYPAGAGARAVLCVPVTAKAGRASAFYLSRPAPPFSEADLDAVTAVTHLVETGLERWSLDGHDQDTANLGQGTGTRAHALERLFGGQARDSVERSLDSNSGALRPVDGTVLALGLLGAGAAARRSRDPEAQSKFYDEWTASARDVLANMGAEPIFGPGSRLTAFFEAQDAFSGRDALKAAVRLRDVTDEVIRRHAGLAGVQARAGLDHGTVLTGTAGGPDHVCFLPIGEPVEIAMRLEGAAPGGSILLTGALLDAASGHFELRSRGEQRIRGRDAPVSLHEIVG